MSFSTLNAGPTKTHTDYNGCTPHQLEILKAFFTYRDAFNNGYIDTNMLSRLHVSDIHVQRSIGGPLEKHLVDFIDAKGVYTGPPGPVGVLFLVDPHGVQEVFFFLRSEADRWVLNPEGREWHAPTLLRASGYAQREAAFWSGSSDEGF
ncbi:MAG: hypothetical protein M1812_002330 [Candelaria pacifica]|nr:MAG: hypothetical protein M1812_002330 [Candelaria pacifica]